MQQSASIKKKRKKVDPGRQQEPAQGGEAASGPHWLQLEALSSRAQRGDMEIGNASKAGIETAASSSRQLKDVSQ